MNLDQITHLARRQHQCAFCGRTVQAGERYVRTQVPGGGRLQKRAFHQGCYRGLVDSASKTNSAKE
ncbi:hypothetical protein [Massilia timonae]|uniref:Uncharacterized protein n=1 Tax=Massilia timonae TaxID=47229 RepID=A0A1S2ND05_9BURK|nr:hypothetical protein [Massilia timonae]OIJ42544.1 hypothetical protein LO55_5074 [Massilia timonae]